MNPFRAILGLIVLILTLVLLIFLIPVFLVFIIILVVAGLIIGIVLRIASIGRKRQQEAETEKPATIKRAKKEKEKVVDAEFEEQ